MLKYIYQLIFGSAIWLTVCVTLSISAAAQDRIALVIGVAKYQHATELKSPEHDAQAVAVSLRNIGFDVIELKGLPNRNAMFDALSEFEKKLRTASAGLFYYSGHGLQISGQNYLVPEDTKLEAAHHVAQYMVRLQRVIEIMRGRPSGGPSIVILDACRDNPLGKNFAGTTGAKNIGYRSYEKGFAPVENAADPGLVIAYATAPGKVALDGSGAETGKYSIFTKALLDHIESPDVEIEKLLRNVRKEVALSTKKKQIPWTSISLVDDFYLVGGKTKTKKKLYSRSALLIGNTDYQTTVGSLTSPKHDVKVIGKSLKKIGFDVETVQNATRIDTFKAILEHAKRSRSSGPEAVSIVYYSGHGVGDLNTTRNFIIPVDAPSTDPDILSYASVQLSDLLFLLQNKAPEARHFIIFDACREELIVKGSKGLAKGFIALTKHYPKMLVAFSTRPGRQAVDTGENSGPFATALAEEFDMLPQSEKTLNELFHDVKFKVSKSTGQTQVPWIEDNHDLPTTLSNNQ